MKKRVSEFLKLTGIQHPVLLAPMAGVCPPKLSATVANAGGMGACGALLYNPEQIAEWCADFRAQSSGQFQINLWTPDPEPVRNLDDEAAIRAALSNWGPDVDPNAGNAKPLAFEEQAEAVIAANSAVFSTIMGIPSPAIIDKLHKRGILWFATVTSVAEGLEAAAAGADVLVAQGSEAGGHRGAFDSHRAISHAVGTFSLVPSLAAKTNLPIVATGGIVDGKTACAALMLGASAVQIGTGYLRTPEAGLNPAWAEAIGKTLPEETALTRGFSGRPGRSIRTGYVRAIETGDLPDPAPYPVQRGLSAAMRSDAAAKGDIERMQAWAGQSAMLASSLSAADLTAQIAGEIEAFLG